MWLKLYISSGQTCSFNYIPQECLELHQYKTDGRIYYKESFLHFFRLQNIFDLKWTKGAGGKRKYLMKIKLDVGCLPPRGSFIRLTLLLAAVPNVCLSFFDADMQLIIYMTVSYRMQTKTKR